MSTLNIKIHQSNDTINKVHFIQIPELFNVLVYQLSSGDTSKYYEKKLKMLHTMLTIRDVSIQQNVSCCNCKY